MVDVAVDAAADVAVDVDFTGKALRRMIEKTGVMDRINAFPSLKAPQRTFTDQDSQVKRTAP